MIKFLSPLRKPLQVFTKSDFDLPSKTAISSELLSSVVSLIGSCFKTELAPIVDLALRLPTNDPCPSANVSQGGERGSFFEKGWRRQKQSCWEGVSYSNPNFNSIETYYDILDNNNCYSKRQI